MIGAVGGIVALVGWYALHSIWLLIVGTVLYILETVVNWKKLTVKAKITDIIIFFTGSIIAIYTSTSWYIGGMLAISMYNLFVSIMSVIHLCISWKES